MELVEKLFADISSFMWGWPMLILLLGTHIFLTIRLKFPQRYLFKAIKLSVTKDKGADGDVSQFGALATSLAATIGTGNIIGVATAISLGGAGAVFWCWLTGVLGMATKYGEGLLAIKYRVVTKEGKMLGGPMFAIEKGLKMKWLAVLFCIFTVIASFGIGNTIQANSISTMLSESFGVDTSYTGLVLVVLIAAVIILGVRGITSVCSRLVPIMAVLYIVGCVVLLVFNRDYIGESISLIMSSAFTGQAAGGGFAGATVMMAMRYGVARGLFSNESGLGSAPIIAAAAKTRNPVRQALVSSTSTFWDTVIICALTGIVLVSSIVANPEIDSTAGAVLTKVAFEQIPLTIFGVNVGTLVLTVGICTFAFSTILGWTYYSERSVEYLSGRHIRTSRYVFRVVWVVGIFLGSVSNLSLVWNMGDVANALMALPNLLSLILLSGVLVSETSYYLWNDHLDEDDTRQEDLPQVDPEIESEAE